ncbi:hypothetical protein ACLOJK_018816 [Asimina triloba]
MAAIEAKLLASRKVMEEREATIIRDSSLLKEIERHLVSALSDLKKIEETEVALPSLASVSSALEVLRAMSRDVRSIEITKSRAESQKTPSSSSTHQGIKGIQGGD